MQKQDNLTESLWICHDANDETVLWGAYGWNNAPRGFFVAQVVNETAAIGEVHEMFFNESGLIILVLHNDSSIEMVRLFANVNLSLNASIWTITGTRNETNNVTNEQCLYNADLQRAEDDLDLDRLHAGFWQNVPINNTFINTTLCLVNDTLLVGHFDYKGRIVVNGTEEMQIINTFRAIGRYDANGGPIPYGYQIVFVKNETTKHGWYSGVNPWELVRSYDYVKDANIVTELAADVNDNFSKCVISQQ